MGAQLWRLLVGHTAPKCACGRFCWLPITRIALPQGQNSWGLAVCHTWPDGTCFAGGETPAFVLVGGWMKAWLVEMVGRDVTRVSDAEQLGGTRIFGTLALTNCVCCAASL
jgi:hypothetical protein